MNLNPEERKAIVEYRIERALSTMHEAKEISRLGFWNLAANRLYYAAYYAQIALLISEGKTAMTHAGVKSIFHKDYVRTGLLDKENGKLLQDLFFKRISGDYGDQFDWDEEDIMPLLKPTEELINKIIALINL